MPSPSQNEHLKPFFSNLFEVARYSLQIGALTFRGSPYLIEKIERDLVGSWISRSSFSEARQTFEKLPTPLVFQLVTWAGFEQGRRSETPRIISAVSAVSYLAPIFSILLLLSWGLSSLPQTQNLFGANAATFGILTAVLIKAMKKARHSFPDADNSVQKQQIAWWLFVSFGFLLALLRPSLEFASILICGFLSLSPSRLKFRSLVPVGAAALAGVSAWSIHETLLLNGLKAGSLMFGGGLAAIPLLGGEFVDQLQWLTQTRYLEMLTINRVVSAPLIMTVSSIGLLSGGISAAVIGTLAAFTVPFLHVVTWYAKNPGLRRFKMWEEFSFGATAAILGAVVASMLKLLEPIALAALEVEHLEHNRKIVVLTLWILIPAISYYAVQKKQRPAWAVILGGAIISLLALSIV